jgi:mRNA interferase HigB
VNFLNINSIFGMKVHLIRKETIEHFASGNSGSRSPFAEWLTKLKNADWEKPTDIQATFGSADLLGKSSSRTVFNIGGNNYRMICKYFFGEKQVHLFVCWIGTHSEYDEPCDNNEHTRLVNIKN